MVRFWRTNVMARSRKSGTDSETPKPLDVMTSGEALIDICSPEADVAIPDSQRLVPAPGGAPLNVAVGLRRLGVERVAFVGCVGDDIWGHSLLKVMNREGIDTTG